MHLRFVPPPSPFFLTCKSLPLNRLRSFPKECSNQLVGMRRALVLHFPFDANSWLPSLYAPPSDLHSPVLLIPAGFCRPVFPKRRVLSFPPRRCRWRASASSSPLKHAFLTAVRQKELPSLSFLLSILALRSPVFGSRLPFAFSAPHELVLFPKIRAPAKAGLPFSVTKVLLFRPRNPLLVDRPEPFLALQVLMRFLSCFLATALFFVFYRFPVCNLYVRLTTFLVPLLLLLFFVLALFSDSWSARCFAFLS